MPEEYYRIGVVYIYNDDSRSQVYNLRGCAFNSLNSWNVSTFTSNFNDNVDINKLFIEGSYNTKGVFRIPAASIRKNNNMHPIKLEFKLPDTLPSKLKALGIKGYFFVRQARIPIFLMQAFSIGISDNSYTPLLSYYTTEDGSDSYKMFTTSPMRKDTSDENKKNHFIKIERVDVEFDKISTNTTDCHFRGLYSLDVCLQPQLQSLLCGNSFVLKPVGRWNCFRDEKTKIVNIHSEFVEYERTLSRELLYIPPTTPYRSYKNCVFSTKAGSMSDVLSLRSLKDGSEFPIDKYCVRGNYTPYIGVVNDSSDEIEDTVEGNTIYNICTSEYSNSIEGINTCIETRSRNHTEYFAINDPESVDTINVVCARGDCFTCTGAGKFQWNYLDYHAPLNDKIVKDTIKPREEDISDQSGEEWLGAYSKISPDTWTDFNASDVNAVDLGHIITFKFMSNFNCIRSVDSTKIDEISLYGNPRSFYPLSKDVFGVPFKIDDSSIVNMGLSSTKGMIPYYELEQVPYLKNMFDTRVGYSNMHSTNTFSNGYRVFSSINYVDLERTYGAIVKLLPYGANLFCVFEHGCGIIPINQKALIATTSGQIAMTPETAVMQSQITVISPDYGSTWEESIIETPNAIYGVDTFAKKIWKFSAEKFELISDQIVQRFLNDNINLSESDVYPTVAVSNVKTHYNNYKGDVMFTFYNEGKVWNLCYNERIDRFVSRYSWTPLYSGNIHNSYVTIDRSTTELYSIIAQTISRQNGLRLAGEHSLYRYKYKMEPITYLCEMNEDGTLSEYKEFACRIRRAFRLHGFNDMYNAVEAKILSVEYPTWDAVNKRVVLNTIDGNSENTLLLESNNKTDTSDDGAYITSIVGWGGVKQEDTDLTPGIIYEDRYMPDIIPSDASPDDKKSKDVSDFKAKYKNYIQTSLGGDLDLEIKLTSFISWIKIKLLVTPSTYGIENSNKDDDDKLLSAETKVKGKAFEQTICLVADYDYIENVSNREDTEVLSDTTIEEYQQYLDVCKNTLRIGLYTHGRAGIYDEINYFDDNQDNQIKPTVWYNKQEPFEFEFVVNSPAGLQKVFDNLVIISNNAEPESFEFSIIGDAYDFNKAGIFKRENTEPVRENGVINTRETFIKKLEREFNSAKEGISETFKNLFGNSKMVYSAKITKDPVLNEYGLTVSEGCRNVKSAGRRLGNIEYREDKWLVNISPIYFKKHMRASANSTDIVESNIHSAKLRDKWIKVRVKYKGDKLVVISAIQTLMTLSYA